MPRTFETIISVLDKFSAPIIGLEDKLAKLGHVGEATQKQLNMSPSMKLWHQLNAHVNEARAVFGELGAQIGEVGSRLGEVLPMMGAIGGAASVAGLMEMAHATAEAAEALENISKITGIATPELQKLDFMGQQVGVSTEVLGKGFEMLNVRIGRAAIGMDKHTAETLHKLGINLRDSAGHVRSTADVMPQLEKAFDDTKDPALRAALAMQLFGRSGVEMLPFLNMGPDKFKDLQEQFNKFGYTFSGSDKAGLEQFREAWGSAGLAIEGLKDDISAKLAPVMAPLLTDFATFLSQNRDLIAADLKGVIVTLGDDLKNVDFKTISGDIMTFSGDIKTAIDDVGGFKTALEIVGGMMALSFAAPILELGFSVGSLGAKLAWMASGPAVEFAASAASMIFAGEGLEATLTGIGLAAEANPLGVLIIAAGLCGYAAWDLYEKWDTVSKDLSGIFQYVEGEFHKAFDPIEAQIKTLESAWDKLTGQTGNGDSNPHDPAPRPNPHLHELSPAALAAAGPARIPAPKVTVTVNNALPGTTVTSSSSNGASATVVQNTGSNGTIKNHRG